MGRAALRRAGGALAALALAACSTEVKLPEDAKLSCTVQPDCPEGLLCHNGLCVPPGSIDTTPPDLVPGSFSVSPARGRAGTAFTVAISATEALLEPPRVSLGLVPTVDLTCSGAGGDAFTCSYTATGAENDTRGGDLSIDVRMRDRAGNETVRSTVGTLSLDFDPPAVTVASVAYFPAPTNPLPAVSRATAGTAVRVSVSSNELLSPVPAPTLVARRGADALSFTLTPGGLGDADVLFEAIVPPGLPDGAYALEVSWSDEVGNAGTTPVASPAVLVKTSTPTLLVDQDAIVFVRSPWGNAAPEDLGEYTIPAGPYFALEPADPLSGTATLPAGAFQFLDGGAPSAVQVRLSAAPGALLLGTLRPDAGGTWPRQPLASPDTETVAVTGIDDAGNRSAPVTVRSVEWVASSGASAREPALVVRAVPVFGPYRSDASVASTGAAEEVTGLDGQALRLPSTPRWVEVRPGGDPGTRSAHAMACDTARRRLVLFGGSSGGTYKQDTWEWDGRAWREAAAAGAAPPPRMRAAMAYDSVRGRVVLFGGYSLNVLGDTWEWDGAAWRDVTPPGTGPAPRSQHAMAFDSARGRVVMFGGTGAFPSGQLGDTWEWDGTAWHAQTPAGAIPAARNGHAMAFDSARGRVVLFGGAVQRNDTWEWDGSTWNRMVPSDAAPPGRAGHALAFDSARGRTVLFGGYTTSAALQDTWEWDGVTWRATAPPGAIPAPRAEHAMAFDPSAGRVVVHGGGGGLADTWAWDGAAWRDVSPSGAAPSERIDPAMAFDSLRGRTVLFGGSVGGVPIQGTWEWDRRGWREVTPPGASPPPRTAHAMAFDPVRGRAVLFGGFSGTGHLADTWEWDGSAWFAATPTGTSPPARIQHAMAFDPVRSRVVLFGGRSESSVTRGDLWEWDGSSWSEVVPSGARPPPRYGHSVALDGARGRIVVFAGQASTIADDTWEWDGSTWSEATPTSRPPPRTEHAMAFEPGSARMVLFGGSYVQAFLNDTWTWDGSGWHDVASPSAPAARQGHAISSAGEGVVVFGGWNGSYLRDTWEYTAATGRAAAFQVDTSTLAAALAPSVWTGLRVRAFAGGYFHPRGPSDTGVTLVGWTSHDPVLGPGAWVPLASNTAGAAAEQPYLGLQGTTLLDWSAASAEEARRFVTERDGRLSFQVRPSGPMGPDPGGAAVALDYVEVRIRYTAP